MFLLFIFLSFLFPFPTLALETNRSVQVTASIGQNRVTIDGYTSPGSKVELSSSRVFSITFSQSDGYFIFDRIILPKDPSDLCLTSQDDNSRRSFPVCIPAPPPQNYQTDIGPILLSPTLSLDSDTVRPNQSVVASGQSIPNSTININFFQINQNAAVFPKAAQAFSLPTFSTTTDDLGNYSLNLPTAYSSNYRLYASTIFDGFNSSKSNILTYALPSLLWSFWLENSWLIITLPIFVITLTMFFYLIHKSYLQPKRFLPAIFSFPLAIPTSSNPFVLRTSPLD
jgi:hypothetical protein